MKKLFTLLILLCAVVTANADDTWTVLGTMTSPTWEPGEVTMTDEDGDGIFKASINIVTAGDYEFKVRKNNSWAESYSGQANNNCWVTTTADNTTVTFYYDSSTHAVWTSTNTKDTYVYVQKTSNTAPHLYVESEKGSYKTTHNCVWPGAEMHKTIVENGVEYWVAGPFENSYNPDWDVKYIIKDDAGNTADIWAKKTKLGIYYSGGSSYNRLPNIQGLSGEWDYGYLMSKNASGEYEVTCTPAWAEAQYKIVYDGGWYGIVSEASTITAPGNYTLSTSGNNMVIRLERPVTLKFNGSTKNLNVVCDDNDLSLNYFAATDGATYDTSTHEVTTTTDWKGISQWIGGSNTKKKYLIAKTRDAVKLGWYVQYKEDQNLEEESRTPTNYNESSASKMHICAIDNTKTVIGVLINLQEEGSTTFEELYSTGSESITITGRSDGNGWMTYVAPANLYLTSNSKDIEAYKIYYDKNTNQIYKNLIDGQQVPSGSAVLLYKSSLTNGSTAIIEVPVLSSATALTDNHLTSGSITVNDASAKVYGLAEGSSGVGFYRAENGTTIPDGIGYLKIDVSSGDPILAPAFFALDGGTTAIDALTTETAEETATQVFDLGGRKVSGKLSKGIYVKNGKKFIVK